MAKLTPKQVYDAITAAQEVGYTMVDICRAAGVTGTETVRKWYRTYPESMTTRIQATWAPKIHTACLRLAETQSAPEPMPERVVVADVTGSAEDVSSRNLDYVQEIKRLARSSTLPDELQDECILIIAKKIQ